MSGLSTLFGWAGTPPWPDHDRAAVASPPAAARSGEAPVLPTSKRDAHRRALLLAKRAELAAVRDVLREMHAREMAFEIEKAAIADLERSVFDVTKDAANVQGVLHRDAADDPTFSSKRPYIPNYEKLTVEEERERERCLLNFLQNISQGADPSYFLPMASKRRPLRSGRNNQATSTILADEDEPPHRPTSEGRVTLATHDPDPDAALPYPRSARRGASTADGYFDVRAGTKLHEQTPSSFGVSEGFRYGRGEGGEHNVQTPTAGALLDAPGRDRTGEQPTRRGSRKRPPTLVESTNAREYGTKGNGPDGRSGPRVIGAVPVADEIPQRSTGVASENVDRKLWLTGRGPIQPRRGKRPPSRRQGYLE